MSEPNDKAALLPPGPFKDMVAAEVAELLRGFPKWSFQWARFGLIWRGAWRPTAGWALVLTIIVNGVILPMARLWGFDGEPLDWTALAAFLAAFVGLVKYRSDDKQAGVTT